MQRHAAPLATAQGADAQDPEERAGWTLDEQERDYFGCCCLVVATCPILRRCSASKSTRCLKIDDICAADSLELGNSSRSDGQWVEFITVHREQLPALRYQHEHRGFRPDRTAGDIFPTVKTILPDPPGPNADMRPIASRGTARIGEYRATTRK
ncbi:hypothetical protein [Sphingobium sp. CAP-1]|uniref:hypothetical protein n=1 Tax=Sphingobium sp. CAP-1 TaxID=2676077 RepID=UPI001E2F43FE|nr:hypothetical protein [Sphingobium sp. CAP-1]